MPSLLQKAPDFRAPAVVGQGDFTEVSLSDYLGRYVVLIFYPLDFSFICPTELVMLGQRYSEFRELGAQILGLSCDSHYSHKAWLEHALGQLPFPLVSDYSKSIATSYGALLPGGFPARATFIVDPDNTIQFVSVTAGSVGRNVEEVLRVLDALQSDELCACNWHKGEPTIDAVNLLGQAV